MYFEQHSVVVVMAWLHADSGTRNIPTHNHNPTVQHESKMNQGNAAPVYIEKKKKLAEFKDYDCD